MPIKQLAYITERNNNVTVLDISNNTVIANIPVGLNAAGIAFTPDKSRAYVTNAFGSSVSIIDTKSNTVMKTIGVGSYPEGVVITPDGTRAYVLNRSSNSISVIDITSNTIISTITVGSNLYAIAILVELSPQEEIKLITAKVIAILNAGMLSQKEGKKLISELNKVIEEIVKGKSKSAIKNLQSFVNEVYSFIQAGKLSTKVGQELIDAANRVINTLS